MSKVSRDKNDGPIENTQIQPKSIPEEIPVDSSTIPPKLYKQADYYPNQPNEHKDQEFQQPLTQAIKAPEVRPKQDGLQEDVKVQQIELVGLKEKTGKFGISQSELVKLIKKASQRKKAEDIEDIAAKSGIEAILQGLNVEEKMGIPDTPEDMRDREASFDHNRKEKKKLTPFCQLFKEALSDFILIVNESANFFLFL